MLKSNRLSVFEIANRVVINNTTDEVVEGLAGHQSEKNTSAHEVSNISGLQSALDGKQNVLTGFTGSFSVVTHVDFPEGTVTTKTITVSNGVIVGVA